MSWSLLIFSSVLALWSRAYLHSGVMNGVTTGIGGVKRRFMGPTILLPTLHVLENYKVEVFVCLASLNYQRVFSNVLA